MASKNASTDTAAKTESAGSLVTNSAAGAALPAFMQDNAGDGKEDIDNSDLIIPRVALLQGISPPVMAGLGENGHFWHTINEVDLGDELTIVPIVYRKQVTLWSPLHMGGGIIARSSDGKTWDSDFDVMVAPYKDFPKKTVRYAAKKGDSVGVPNVPGSGLIAWGSQDPENEDSGPAATVSHVIVCRALDHMDLGPFAIFLQRSAERVGKELVTKIKTDKAPIYGQVLKLTKRTATNDASQEYNKPHFAKAGWVTDEQVFLALKAEHEMFKTTSFRLNDEDAATEGGAEGGGSTSGPAAKDAKDDKY